jgi:hypothetical protein
VDDLRCLSERKRDGAPGRVPTGLGARTLGTREGFAGELGLDDAGLGFLARFFEPNRDDRIDIIASVCCRRGREGVCEAEMRLSEMRKSRSLTERDDETRAQPMDYPIRQ